MSPQSRRSLLATLATGAVGAVAGCNESLPPSAEPTTTDRLANRSLYVADGVPFPDVDGARRVSDVADADVAVFPPDTDPESVGNALASGVVAAVVGTDAQSSLRSACESTDRSYGFARDSWGGEETVVVGTPRDGTVDTHLFAGVDVADDVPWALGEAFDARGPPCELGSETDAVPDEVADRLEPVGASRIRGVNDAGGFDRWDRVRAASNPDGSLEYVVDVSGTIFAGRAARTGSRYASDRVRLVAETDDRIEGVGLGAGGVPADDVRVEDRSDRGEGVVELAATADGDDARRSFTACQRAYVVSEADEPSVAYTANGRFRWRKSGLLDDEYWYHHTPGRARWRPRLDD